MHWNFKNKLNRNTSEVGKSVNYKNIKYTFVVDTGTVSEEFLSRDLKTIKLVKTKMNQFKMNHLDDVT